jgi:hypothetical protein
MWAGEESERKEQEWEWKKNEAWKLIAEKIEN